jgi:hypothetical protein
MKLKPKNEMNKLLWSFTIPVLLLVAIILLTYLVYGIVNADNNAKRTRELLIDQAVKTYQKSMENFKNLSQMSPDLMKDFNPDILKAAFSGDTAPIHKLTRDIMLLTNPALYVAIIDNGKIVDESAAVGTTAHPKGLPTAAPKSGYVILDNFSGKKGTFLDLFSAVDLTKVGINSKFVVSFIIDATDQIKQIDQHFHDQKQNTVIGLVITGIVALILFGLLSTFWLRYLIDKYIRKPMKRLDDMAREIAAGTYEEEITVDEDSDFAALQGLLRSGQLILRQLDKNMGDES